MPPAGVGLHMDIERPSRVGSPGLGVLLRLVVIGVAFSLIAFAAACDGTQTSPDPGPPGPPVTTPTPSATAGPDRSPDAPVSSTPGPRTTPTAIPTSGTPVAEPGRALALAPIENVEVLSTKPQAVLRVGSGLPSGCARWAGVTVEQRRAEVIVQVYNSMPTGAVACTAIYGYTTHDVVLGSLAPGAYKVRVNDRTVDLVVP